ncbi:MAG: hypothetical protein K8J09_09400 [Planctomycetes bacterium]|nr:hypothetical protein [Planctomycetota bacterium]MCC7122106.1 hypothetical protein [Gammaproteobacteria bacterium]
MRVARPAVLLTDDGEGELVAVLQILSIALVRCAICRGRFRLLPADVLPHKHYGLAVIASIAASHVEANKSLRTAAWTTHTGQTPAHTTLHAWTEGLGAFALGRSFGGLPDAHPYQATMAAITARWSVLETEPLRPLQIDPIRYRSGARGERLVAVAKVLASARTALAIATLDVDLDLAPDRSPLSSLRQLAVHLGVPAPLLFRTGIQCTPSEHLVARDPESPGLPQPTGDSVCQTRSRSPPSASSRSLPSSIPPSIPASDGT